MQNATEKTITIPATRETWKVLSNRQTIASNKPSIGLQKDCGNPLEVKYHVNIMTFAL